MRDGRYDCVLVDAPCSGLGTLRRHPEIKWRWRSGDDAFFAREQRQCLSLGLSHLAPNGRLVYSVCTVLPAEGAERVRGRAEGELRIEQELSTWPDEGMDGFYAASMLNRGA